MYIEWSRPNFVWREVALGSCLLKNTARHSHKMHSTVKTREKERDWKKHNALSQKRKSVTSVQVAANNEGISSGRGGWLRTIDTFNAFRLCATDKRQRRHLNAGSQNICRYLHRGKKKRKEASRGWHRRLWKEAQRRDGTRASGKRRCSGGLTQPVSFPCSLQNGLDQRWRWYVRRGLTSWKCVQMEMFCVCVRVQG